MCWVSRGRGEGLVYAFEVKFDPVEYADKWRKFQELKGEGWAGRARNIRGGGSCLLPMFWVCMGGGRGSKLFTYNVLGQLGMGGGGVVDFISVTLN